MFIWFQCTVILNVKPTYVIEAPEALIISDLFNIFLMFFFVEILLRRISPENAVIFLIKNLPLFKFKNYLQIKQEFWLI